MYSAFESQTRGPETGSRKRTGRYKEEKTTSKMRMQMAKVGWLKGYLVQGAWVLGSY